ncbi:MAG: beta-ketoacyl-[acyl-carrier-protein] synthase family protein [Thermoanaerobaculia bacterium]|nr:beta-ketoacyl-[acyl-carrier-protein] synthase family protein [Thermoanaerobaculia bacterium]
MSTARPEGHESGRIVVTGLGLVTPVGHDRVSTWNALLAGVDGIGEVESFDTSRHSSHRGGEVKGFDPVGRFRKLDPMELGRASQLAVFAAREAVEDAGLETAGYPSHRLGVAMGTTSGEPGQVEDMDDRWLAGELDRMGAFARLYPSHVIAGHVAAELEIEGVVTMLPAACAAGNYAVGFAVDALRTGRADAMLAGGADAFSRITYTGFARLGAIAPEICQPFDRGRQGMMPGEAGAVLVLERERDARRRGAEIYAVVTGYGLSCDAHHMTAAHPEGDGAVRAMKQALRFAGLAADQISYVSAHGTGTPTNDRLETKAVRTVFGDRRLPVSSIKSMIGHTMGAASAVESAVCCLAVSQNRVPPTIHYEEPDPECDLDCVPNEAREIPVNAAMNNAYAFGGNNASVIFTKLNGSAR